MAKFNVVQKRRRAAMADKKRAVHGDPSSKKLKIRPQPISISGKRQRKLLKKWRRDQKEAVASGLVTMEDVEMAIAEGEGSSKDVKKTRSKFNMKKKKGLKLKQLKHKSKKQKKSKTAVEASVDSMME